MEEKLGESLSKVKTNTVGHFVNQMFSSHNIRMQKYKLATAYRMMVLENLQDGENSDHKSLKILGYSDHFCVIPFGFLTDGVTPDNLIMEAIERADRPNVFPGQQSEVEQRDSADFKGFKHSQLRLWQ